MTTLVRLPFACALALLGVSCASQEQPKISARGAMQRVRHVRTTAYTHTEAGGRRNAIGQRLSNDKVKSAAADWSRWPAGTVFRLLSTGQNYRVEDYGWALSGRNTIDLYMANQREMNNWGARHETIEVLKWGDPEESLQFLRRHQDYRHIKRMVLELEGREKEAASLR